MTRIRLKRQPPEDYSKDSIKDVQLLAFLAFQGGDGPYRTLVPRMARTILKQWGIEPELIEYEVNSHSRTAIYRAGILIKWVKPDGTVS